MLHIILYTVGNVPKGPIQALVDEYGKFLGRYAKIDHRSVQSSDNLIERIPEGHLIVLEATGKQLTSEKFASSIRELDQRGEKVTVVIGGPYGLPEELKRRADLLLSLSPMTTTHDLALVFFLEQLFRAFSIAQGTGYHK